MSDRDGGERGDPAEAADVLLDRLRDDHGEEVEAFREEVRDDLAERFGEGWTLGRLLDRRQTHLREAADRFGRGFLHGDAVRAVEEEVAHVTEAYPEVEEEARR
jgi:phosphoglycolate phosphatase-like HAD superfamily hydrolase